MFNDYGELLKLQTRGFNAAGWRRCELDANNATLTAMKPGSSTPAGSVAGAVNIIRAVLTSDIVAPGGIYVPHSLPCRVFMNPVKGSVDMVELTPGMRYRGPVSEPTFHLVAPPLAPWFFASASLPGGTMPNSDAAPVIVIYAAQYLGLEWEAPESPVRSVVSQTVSLAGGGATQVRLENEAYYLDAVSAGVGTVTNVSRWFDFGAGRRITGVSVQSVSPGAVTGGCLVVARSYSLNYSSGSSAVYVRDHILWAGQPNASSAYCANAVTPAADCVLGVQNNASNAHYSWARPTPFPWSPGSGFVEFYFVQNASYGVATLVHVGFEVEGFVPGLAPLRLYNRLPAQRADA